MIALLAENLFNEVQNESHSVAANEEAAGHGAWRVANGRRQRGDYWTPETENQAAWISVDCGVSVSADMIAIDRGHNLAGKTVKLQVDDNAGFTSPTDVFSVTFPSSQSNTELDTSPGVYTDEGAWVFRFGLETSRYWRLHIGAAASYRPRIVGLWLGLAWEPAVPPDFPARQDGYEIGGSFTTSDHGWSSIGAGWRRQEGELSLRVLDSDETMARAFHDAVTRPGTPFWLVQDLSEAGRAVLAMLPPQGTVFHHPRDWWRYLTELAWVEYQPKRF